MTTVSLQTARRLLVRFLSASAVLIALGATLTTPHPAAAAMPATASQAVPAQNAVANSDAARTRDEQLPANDGAGFGPGWG